MEAKLSQESSTSLSTTTRYELNNNLQLFLKLCHSAQFTFDPQQLGEGANLGRTMWGMLGLGAFGFQLQEVPGDRRIITTTRSHSNKLVIDCVDAMEPHEVLRVGGAGNKVR